MKKNYIYNLILTIFNIIFPILSFPYASRVLGPSGIGRFQFVTSFAQYFILIANLGIPLYGTREIAKYNSDKVQQSKIFSELISIAFLMSVALTIVYLATILFFNYFHSDQDLYITATLSVFLGFTTIDWLYIGMEEFKMIALRSVVIKFLSLILLYTFVKTVNDVLIYLYVGIFSSLANNAYNLLTARSKVKFTLKNLEMVKHMRPLLLIFGMNLASSMYTLLDVVLLGFLSNPKSVGLYSAAVKLTKITIPFIISVGAVTMPKMAQNFALKNYKEIESLLGKSLHFILFFSIPSFAGLVLLSPELIILFSGKQFMAGTLSMQILALLPFLIGLGYFFGLQILIPAGKDKEMLYSVLGGMIVAVFLNFVLVPKFGDVGEAIANTVTELVVTFFYFYFANKYFRFKFNWTTVHKSILASAFFIPIVLLLRWLNMNTAIMVAMAILGCASVYAAVQWFVFKDALIKNLYDTAMLKLKGKEQTA